MSSISCQWCGRKLKTASFNRLCDSCEQMRVISGGEEHCAPAVVDQHDAPAALTSIKTNKPGSSNRRVGPGLAKPPDDAGVVTVGLQCAFVAILVFLDIAFLYVGAMSATALVRGQLSGALMPISALVAVLCLCMDVLILRCFYAMYRHSRRRRRLGMSAEFLLSNDQTKSSS